MEFLKAVGALTAVLYATAIVGCLASDLCSVPGAEEWWHMVGRMGVYSPIISFVIASGLFLVAEIASAIRRRRQTERRQTERRQTEQ